MTYIRHSIKQCLHGFVMSRCKCMGPHTIERVPCPGPGDNAFSRHAEFVAKLEIWAEIVKNQPTPRSELSKTLRAAFDEAESLRIAATQPYASHELMQQMFEARGFMNGIGRAIEILDHFS